MITKKELRIVTGLFEKKDKIESMTRKFDSPYVAISVGVVDVNASSPKSPKDSEYSKYFHNTFPEVVKELNEITVSTLKREVAKIDIELSKYILIVPKS